MASCAQPPPRPLSRCLSVLPRGSWPRQPKSPAETAVKALYATLTDKQKKEICFAWDYQDTNNKRGLLRTFVSNNWQITKPHIKSDFYTSEQQGIIYDIFKGILNPEWEKRILKQLKDDTEGHEWGVAQMLAIFGKPGDDKFEFVMTGRHMTIRADGHSEKSVAFGGPIFYGHAASGFDEKVHHPGNVFWHQAEAANNVYKMLSGKQQEAALVKAPKDLPKKGDALPKEKAVGFRKSGFPGIPVTEMSADQKKELQQHPHAPGGTVPQGRSRRGAGVPQEAGRARQVQSGLLRGWGHRR